MTPGGGKRNIDTARICFLFYGDYEAEMKKQNIGSWDPKKSYQEVLINLMSNDKYMAEFTKSDECSS